MSDAPLAPEIIGRYALYGQIASGGMATVHMGRLLGPVGFSRTVAIKRMHPQFTGDPQFVSMFLDEARLAARVRHPNVVSTLDVVTTNGELFLVLDYVQGETLSTLCRRIKARGERVPVPIVAAILSGVLHGLHAAHEATNERGEPLGIVHRDISPQNVIVGIDGVARILDFGVAKAAGRLQTTHAGTLKGKIAYMPQEQVLGLEVTRRCDVYAAAVVLWETLVGRPLFRADNEATTLHNLLHLEVKPPSAERPEVPRELDAVVLRGLAREPGERFATAREMATALEAAAHVAIAPAVGAWVDAAAADTISAQAARIAAIESDSDVSAHVQRGDTLAAAGVIGARVASPSPTGQQEIATRTISSSQVSALSVAGVPRPVSPQGRRTAVVGVAAALCAVTVTVFVMRHGPQPSSSSPAAGDPVPVASHTDVPSAQPPSPLPAATQPPAAPASATPAPVPTRAAPPPRPPVVGKRPVAAPSQPPPPPAATYNPLDHL